MDDRQKRELKDNPMLALELLTAGGSEFHNDPVRCYQDIRHKLEFRHQKIVEAMRQRDAAEAEVARLRGILADLDHCVVCQKTFTPAQLSGVCERCNEKYLA